MRLSEAGGGGREVGEVAEPASSGRDSAGGVVGAVSDAVPVVGLTAWSESEIGRLEPPEHPLGP